MSAVSVEAQIIIDPNINTTPEKLEALQQRLADMKPVMADIGDIFQQELADNFDSQGGGSWVSLAPSTIRRKTTDQMLVETGALRDALTTRGAAGNKFLVSNNEVVVGVYPDVLPRAWWINSGTRRMPARMIINVTDMNRVVNALVDFLSGGDPELAKYIQVLQDVNFDSQDAPEIDLHLTTNAGVVDDLLDSYNQRMNDPGASDAVRQQAISDYLNFSNFLEPWSETASRFADYGRVAIDSIKGIIGRLWQ